MSANKNDLIFIYSFIVGQEKIMFEKNRRFSVWRIDICDIDISAVALIAQIP